jgi:protein-S-isoprenylcysteine O-methyltransferase Ste14
VTRTDRLWVVMQILVVIAIVLALIILKPPEERLLPIWVGIVFCLVSLALFVSSFVAHAMVNRTIQVNVSPSPDPQKRLVARGIYAYVRHPMYLSGILLLVGATIWQGNVVAIGGGLMATLFFYLKSIHEEQLLLQVYVDYPAYMKRTGRLLPRLRR